MVLFTYLLIYVCIRDKASAATSNTDPTNSKIRLYIIFYTNISGKQLEVGNGEIKRKSASKKVDEARLGKIGVCKRQLHLIMKHTGTTDNFVTFGVLIHGNVKLKVCEAIYKNIITFELWLRYEFFVVSCLG